MSIRKSVRESEALAKKVNISGKSGKKAPQLPALSDLPFEIGKKNPNFTHLNPVQALVYPHWDEDCNLVITANTSAGKTMAAEIMFIQSLQKGKKCFFISPLKAVSSEKHDDWTDPEHCFSKYKLSILTGDFQMTEKRVKELKEADIVIMTAEMFDSRTRRIETEKNSWLKEGNTVVVDEAHLITTDRGDCVESSLVRYSLLVPDSRIVLMTATMPNNNELCTWLEGLNGKKTYLIDSDWRPCKLDVHWIPYHSGGSYNTREVAKVRSALEIVEMHPDDQFLVGVHSKKSGRLMLEALTDAGIEAEFHNSDLGKDARRKIEEEFKKGMLKVIVCTPTLFWGVNIPARRVISVGVNRGLQYVESYQVRQLIGRAGRVGLAPKGDAYILLPSNRFNALQDKYENLEPIKSRMAEEKTMAFHIVSEMHEGRITDAASLTDWFNRTLAAVQGHFIDRAEAEMMITKLRRLLIFTKEETWKLTGLGRTSALMYFNPYDVSAWYFNFSQIFKKNLEFDSTTLSWALSNIPSNDDFYLTSDCAHILDDYNNRLGKYGLEANTRTQAGLIYWTHMENMDVYSLRHAKSTLSLDADRIFTALRMIDDFYANWKLGKMWKIYSSMVVHGVPKDAAVLCMMNGIGGTRARKLVNVGIMTTEDFKNNEQLASSLIGPNVYKKARNSIQKIDI